MPEANGAFTFTVADRESGIRLDLFLSERLDGCSRSYAGQLIRNQCVRVDAVFKKPAHRVSPGEVIHGHIPPPEPIRFGPEPMALDIRFEDDELLVVNKPAGLVVHPAPGHPSGTLVNGILFHCPEIEGVGGALRPGIVHRLDKDTSGLIVVAKTTTSHHGLAAQFKGRTVGKTYLAIVCGCPEANTGTIQKPISRHPVERKQMSTRNPRGRAAVTHWRVRERFNGAAFLELELRTGRTHQIRVHLADAGHPLVGDAVYGGRRFRNWKREVVGRCPPLKPHLDGRQMLHAWRLTFRHPASGRDMAFSADIPTDMGELAATLRNC